MKKHFLIVSIFAGLFLSVFFVSCEKETVETSSNTDQTETINIEPRQKDIFPWWWYKPQTQSNNRTPHYCMPGQNPDDFIDCTFPKDGGCLETVTITPKMVSTITDYHDVVSNGTLDIIAEYTEDNGEDLSYYMHKEHLANVVFGKEFVFTKMKETEDFIYFIFSTSSDPRVEKITQIYSFKIK